MSDKVRCRCQSCMIRGLTGPAIVITVGILFLLHQIRGGNLDFGNTWPMILVVIGFIYLASSLSSRQGHVESSFTPVPPPPGVNPPAPPQTPYSTSGQ